MQIIKPVPIIASSVISSNLTEPSDLWANGSHVIGDKVHKSTNSRVYECIADHNDVDPETDVDAETGVGSFWILDKTTNDMALFSDHISDYSERSGSFTVTVKPDGVVNSLAFFNAEGATISIIATDIVDGEFFNETFELRDKAKVKNIYDYFFMPIEKQRDLVVLTLPPYRAPNITITIDAGSNTARCGLVSIGFLYSLATTNYGTKTGTTDYSRYERNEYGRPVFLQRDKSKKAVFDLTVETDEVSSIQRFLTDLAGLFVVWIGDQDREATIIYGVYIDFDLVYESPSISPATIEVEGST